MCKIKPIAVALSFIFCSLCFAKDVIKEVCFQDVCIQAEIADTENKRKRGLMFREILSENQGMLFIFEQDDRYNIWMKNMQFALDIIWIGKDKRIVDIRTNVPPCKETCEGLIPQEKAQYVLEVNAGFTQENKIRIGDRVDF